MIILGEEWKNIKLMKVINSNDNNIDDSDRWYNIFII